MAGPRAGSALKFLKHRSCVHSRVVPPVPPHHARSLTHTHVRTSRMCLTAADRYPCVVLGCEAVAAIAKTLACGEEEALVVGNRVLVAQGALYHVFGEHVLKVRRR